MKKNVLRIVLALVGFVVVVGGLGAVKAGQIGAMISAGETFVPPPEAVTTALVSDDTWAASLDAVATLVSVRAVTLGAEVPGLVREVHFESGQLVGKGATLVRLDTALEEAQLAAAEADAQLARANLERITALRKAGTNSPADLDAAEARAKSAAANVQSIRATIEKKTIRAPFAGRLGVRQVELGQVLGVGAPLAPLQAIDNLYVELFLPQQSLSRLALGQKVLVSTDAFPDDRWEAKLVLIDDAVDAATRNVRLRALVANPGGKLRPGMFANASVVLPEAEKVLVIPATGVMFAPYGDSVFVVEEKPGAEGKKDLVVRQQFVRLGERRGDMVAVKTGLQPGQTVVSSGAFKLKNGMSVVVNNQLAPPATLTPKPSDS
jgi:membrane fusion protein (multidrug efflux system)